VRERQSRKAVCSVDVKRLAAMILETLNADGGEREALERRLREAAVRALDPAPTLFDPDAEEGE
jgi:hypothetical protein